MRNNSDTFDQYNQSPQRALRLVVVIEFPTPVYLASHGDISGLPAGALAGVLAKVSSTSQRLIPEAGRAEIGAINFELTDVGGVFTDTLRNQLQAGNGIKGRTVRLYQGGAGMDWADFRLEQTQVAEESLGYDHGRYRVRCRDIQREMRKDIFVPRATRLAADFLKGAGTLSVFSTADFEPCAHPASFGDAPGQTVYYLKIKYQNGWEVVRATGKTATSFTGVTRGLFGTLEYDHTVPTENGDDKGIEVEEYIYIELPAPALAYALLTGTMPGTGNTLPSNWHLGIDPAYAVLDEFENIGSDWFDPADYSKGVILRFEGLSKTDGKKFIEQEINLLLGAYMPVNAAGQLGYRRMAGVLADAGSVASITSSDVVSLGELQQDLAALRNIFSVQWAWYEAPGFDGRFLRSNVLADADSIAVHGEAKPQALKFRGLHNSRHTFTTLKNRFDALRDRFAGPPLRLRLGLLPSNNDIEVGDVVRVSLPQVRDYTRDPSEGVHRWEFTSGKDGWSAPGEGTKIITSAAGGVLSVQGIAFDPYILRSLPVAQRFAGADVPYARIRLRRTSAEPVPAGSNFFWVDEATSTYHAVNLASEVDRLNALPVGSWHVITVDLSGVSEWMDETISLIRWDIGSNHTGTDWSYDVDYVRLLPDPNLDEQSLDRAMEVQRISVDQTSGSVQVELFGSTQKAAAINDEDAGTSAELPDGWYSSAGTEMTAAGLSIDGSGFLTADGTLSGAASSRTVYYYLGDLTIPAGRTLSVTNNVELRVMGVLQIDGTLSGAPGNVGPGFVGSCRGGDGRLQGQYNTSGYAYTGSRGEVVKGRNEVLPPLTIDNDGGALVGIPADLRGSGGADGGKSYYYNASEAATLVGGFGGAGGSGGAGLAVVARGVALGVAGQINTSGSAGAAGTVFPESPVAGGSGGGGAPGGVLLMIDGHQNPQPVLTNSKLVACYGDSPASPGNAGAGGTCLGVNAARVYTVPKSRSPYPNYTQDPEISAELQQALADAAAAQQAAADAQADATSALAKLDDIGADGKLHPSEKLRAVLEYNRLTAEQAGIEASATAFAITTEKTAYSSAVSALTGYLGGLSPDWDDTSAVTTISRTLWNSNWQAVYDARQALLDKVAEVAGQRAKWSAVEDDDGTRPAANADVTADQIDSLRPDDDYKNSAISQADVEIHIANVRPDTDYRNSNTTKAHVGLGNVNNYYVDNAVIDSRANGRIGALRPDSLYHNSNTTKQHVGLGNVDDESSLSIRQRAARMAFGDNLVQGNFGSGELLWSQGAIEGPSGTALDGVEGKYYMRSYDRDSYAHEWFPVEAGEVYYVSGWCFPSTANGDTRLGVHLSDRYESGPGSRENGTTSGWLQGGFVNWSTSESGWVFKEALIVIPSGWTMAKGFLQISATAGNTAYTAVIDPVIRKVMRNQRGLPTTTADMASVNSGSVLSAADAGATASITVAAHTCQFGGYTVSYGAASITGLSFSTRYFIYCDDPGQVGGAVTYFATTSLSTAKGAASRRFLGSITTPADGGSGTVQPPPEDCVDYDTLLPDGRYLRNLQPGDLVECIEVASGRRGLYPLLSMGEGREMCYALQTPEGAEIWQSESTPMDLPDGGMARTPEMLGRPVYILQSGVASLSVVSGVQPLGVRRVLKPNFGNRMFFAGRSAGQCIATHNWTYKP